MSETQEQAQAYVKEVSATPAPQINMENTYVDPETRTIQFEAEAAIRLVLDNTEIADNFVNINQWASGWTMADLLYQSPMSSATLESSTDVANASVPKFMVSNHISAIVPKIMQGIFYEDPCFLLRPSPNTDQDMVTAKTAIFTFQLKSMRFEEEVERGLEQMALLGTGIWKWGYSEYTKKIKKYKRKAGKLDVIDGMSNKKIDTPISDEFEIEFEPKLVSHPWLKFCDLRTVLVDPGLRVGDIREAKWVVYRDFANYEDLNRLRGVEGYNIPSEEVLRQLFADAAPSSGVDNITMTIPEGMLGYLQHARPRSVKLSADPNHTPLELLEYWDADRVIVVLSYNGHNLLIRNEANPFAKIPFFSANWRNIPDNYYGQGLGMLIGSEQIVEQGVTNLALDLLAYCLQPVALRKKGFNAITQNTRWEQGGIIDVEEDVEKAFKFLQMPTPPREAFDFISQSQTTGASTSGANEQVIQGAGHAGGQQATGMRSGTGAAAVIQANASRLDGPTGRFVRQVFEPWLHQMDELDNDLLPTSVIRDILGEELGDAVEVDHIEYRNSQVKYEVLAGASLGAKKEMAQALPVMIQLMTNPIFVKNANDAGFQFDAIAIFQAFAEAAGWRFSQKFLRQMTDQEKKSHAANQPGAIAAAQNANQAQMQDSAFEKEQTLENQRQLGKAGNEAFRASVEKATKPEIMGGPEQTQGFGATTAL